MGRVPRLGHQGIGRALLTCRTTVGSFTVSLRVCSIRAQNMTPGLITWIWDLAPKEAAAEPGFLGLGIEIHLLRLRSLLNLEWLIVQSRSRCAQVRSATCPAFGAAAAPRLPASRTVSPRVLCRSHCWRLTGLCLSRSAVNDKEITDLEKQYFKMRAVSPKVS